MYLFHVFGIVAITSALNTQFGSGSCQSHLTVKRSCPPEWQFWEDECYHVTPLRHNWDDAKSACQAMGGRMAAPHSLEEMEFMADLAQKEHGVNTAWIACNDKGVEGIWECNGQEGSESFLEWANGQPDNSNNQDCAAIATAFNNRMDDDQCWSSHEAICVRQATGTHPSTQPRQYCLSTDTDGRILNSTCLLDHGIREFITEGMAACGSACVKETGCLSFNIKKTEDGKKVCQLNNSTRSEDKDKFQKTGYFCIYSEVCIG
ncbi:type-2 ice-structuring protein-like [Patiria miniata]|uniref:C-type lectin domain-containing protein n=1 Tax=Patiria miniata TaxID=46514 RepID=A0A914BM82_PATMI|nr:type-2 ice-structuring protein-like [Patiria miniata]